MKKEAKVMTLFLFITVCVLLSCMRAGADEAFLRQIDGKSVTAPGQLVEFVGTNGFNVPGIDLITRSEFEGLFRKNDPIDRWLVMQIDGEFALIVKQIPIAFQKFGGPTYNQSYIKNTVETWFSNLPPIMLNGKPFRDYVASVRLGGADQNSPSGDNLTDQEHYRTVVDPNGAKIAFVSSLIDVNPEVNNNLNAGKDKWQALDIPSTHFQEFFQELSKVVNNVSPCLEFFRQEFQQLAYEFENINKTWLRSPLGSPTKIARIDNAGKIRNIDTADPYSDSQTDGYVRPAFWVRISPPLQQILEKRSQILAKIIREALSRGAVPWKLILAEMGYIGKLPESVTVTPHIKQDCQNFAQNFQSRKDEMCLVQEARAHLGNIVGKWKEICPGGEFNEMDQVLTEMGTDAVAAARASVADEARLSTEEIQALESSYSEAVSKIVGEVSAGKRGFAKLYQAQLYHPTVKAFRVKALGVNWLIEEAIPWSIRENYEGQGKEFWDAYKAFLEQKQKKKNFHLLYLINKDV